MNKKRIFGTMTIITIVLLAFTLIGCGDEEGGPTGGGDNFTITGYPGPANQQLYASSNGTFTNASALVSSAPAGYGPIQDNGNVLWTYPSTSGPSGTFWLYIYMADSSLMISNTQIAISNGSVEYSAFNPVNDGGDTPTVPTITTTSLPNGTVGILYNQMLVATGTTPIAWEIQSGNLPSGLTLNPNGTISGTPNSANTFNFTVSAINTVGNDTQELSIIILSGGGMSGVVTIDNLPTIQTSISVGVFDYQGAFTTKAEYDTVIGSPGSGSIAATRFADVPIMTQPVTVYNREGFTFTTPFAETGQYLVVIETGNTATHDEPRYYGQVQFNNGNATVNYNSPTFDAGMLGGN